MKQELGSPTVVPCETYCDIWNEVPTDDPCTCLQSCYNVCQRTKSANYLATKGCFAISSFAEGMRRQLIEHVRRTSCVRPPLTSAVPFTRPSPRALRRVPARCGPSSTLLRGELEVDARLPRNCIDFQSSRTTNKRVRDAPWLRKRRRSARA